MNSTQIEALVSSIDQFLPIFFSVILLRFTDTLLSFNRKVEEELGVYLYEIFRQYEFDLIIPFIGIKMHLATSLVTLESYGYDDIKTCIF